MSKRTFNYEGISIIEIEGPTSLLERIAENMEGEQGDVLTPSCKIKINQSEYPEEIKKDKRFAYLTIEKFGTLEQPSIKYTRYNTLVRTIHQKSPDFYEVDSNVSMDEASGLICVRNHLSNNPQIARHPLLHASLININGQGLLITGNSRQGKTSLTIYLLQEHGGVFISDENVILDVSGEKDLRGLYIPRAPRVRFSTIASSKLSVVLKDLGLANATQYLDKDFIEETIKNRNFEIEWGLAFSRKSFCRSLGVMSEQHSPINTIVFPRYCDIKDVSIEKIRLEEGIRELSKSGLVRKSDIDPKELKETTLDLDPNCFKGINFVRVEFSCMEDLLNKGIEL